MEDGADDTDGPYGAFSRYADGLHAYAHSLLRDTDAAADATVDALLVAGAAADELADRTRLRPWLYALVRNEALRRCAPADRLPLGAEAAELTLRHRLAPADVAAVLGHPAEDADRLATAAAHTLGSLPADEHDAARWAWRTRLAAARRAEVVRRARPFDHDGFPVPVDRPRLSARAVVWTAATVVAVALVLLVTMPVGGRASTGTAPAEAPAPAGTRTAEATPTPTASRRPVPQPDRGDRRRPATEAEPAGTARPAGAGRISLVVGWTPVEAPGCEPRWTATVDVRAVGPLARDVTGVEVSWPEAGRRRTVALRDDGDSWTGALPDLPLGDAVAVTVTGTADGALLAPARAVLAHAC